MGRLPSGSGGGGPLIDVAVQIILGVLFTSRVVRWDERRLSLERRARGWNTASFWSAVVAFGPLCIPVHFARTRRTVTGFLLGVLWMLAVLVVLSLAAEGIAWLTE